MGPVTAAQLDEFVELLHRGPDMRIPGACSVIRSVTDAPLSPSPGYLHHDPMSEVVHVTFVTVVPTGESPNHSIFGPVPASHAGLGFTLLIGCGTRLSSLKKRSSNGIHSEHVGWPAEIT